MNEEKTKVKLSHLLDVLGSNVQIKTKKVVKRMGEYVFQIK